MGLIVNVKIDGILIKIISKWTKLRRIKMKKMRRNKKRIKSVKYKESNYTNKKQ